ncbi:MAG: hypothetical protein LBI18_16260 [Planctomycetaceae bacterium]|nr:hypothetical protein [Planctomycetaceae bacterium]
MSGHESLVDDLFSLVGNVITKVGDVASKVGDVSPKHHIGESRLAPVSGWQLDSKPLGNTNCRPNTRSSCLTATQPPTF